MRSTCEAQIASSNDAKILAVIFAMDGCLVPENSKNSDDFKRVVAAATAGTKIVTIPQHYAKFCEFYKEVRNRLVQHGKTYGELGRDRSTDLSYLHNVIGRVLQNLVASAAVPFATWWEESLRVAKLAL